MFEDLSSKRYLLKLEFELNLGVFVSICIEFLGEFVEQVVVEISCLIFQHFPVGGYLLDEVLLAHDLRNYLCSIYIASAETDPTVIFGYGLKL